MSFLKLPVVNMTVSLTFPDGVDMRRGGATEPEGEAVRVVRDLHNPGRGETSHTSVRCACILVPEYLWVLAHSLALVATSSRRERRTQKAWLIMVSTSENGLRNSRSSLMVWIFLPTCRPAICTDRQETLIYRLQLVWAR